LYSGLLEFWPIFESIIELSPLDSNGYFTLAAADVFLRDLEIDMTRYEFWEAIKYALSRKNHDVYIQRKVKKGK